MFTGIVETIGTIVSVQSDGSNTIFQVKSSISDQLKTDQSVSHDGVCLTVERVSGDVHTVTAIDETLKKTNLSTWHTGSKINLERCLQFNGRIDGHIVQGHVDTTATCIRIDAKEGSWELRFRFPKAFSGLVIEKGSISINGTSLTVFNAERDCFDVAIIPYTFENTTIGNLAEGSIVNIEFDIIGKYIQRHLELKAE
jgi:riboflavin synthase